MNSLCDTLAQALSKIQARIDTFSTVDISSPTSDAALNQAEKGAHTRLAIAYSGGLDSSVLLHVAQAYAKQKGIVLHAFHIHHGLSANADQWLEHCRQTCAEMKVIFDTRRVAVTNLDVSGVEEAARFARYAALGALCVEYDIPLLLTAHHLDDQAETVMLQLLRGSGVAGMSGMDIANRAPGLLGNDTVTMARPLLAVSRSELECYANQNALQFIEDESNHDPRYARNALRHQVMPILANCFPGFQQRFARTAQHAQAGQRLLVELAAQDFATCRVGEALDLGQIRKLGADRTDNLLRYWFGTQGLRMPSTAWLSEMRAQLLEAKADAQLCVTHPDVHIRRYRERVFITPRDDTFDTELEPIGFRWMGEEKLHFPLLRGNLHFELDEAGIDVQWLKGRDCSIHYRQGGEKLKLAENRPTKSLKYHYQAMDIPAWERERLPLVSSAGKLLFAAGLGMDCAQTKTGGGPHVRLRWQGDLIESAALANG